MNKIFTQLFFCFIISGAIVSCSSSSGLFTRKTAREKYEEEMKGRAGKSDPVLNKWRNVGEYSLLHPYSVPGDYTESGKFFSSDSTATSFLVNIKRGQKLKIIFQSPEAVNTYLDLWRGVPGNAPSFIISADTLTNTLEYIANADEQLITRFQGEIGFAGNYTFILQTGPSLGFPIAAGVKAPIGSFWGDGRDGGARKHEGVDIIAPKHSYAVAAANGVVTSVSENDLGGKVVSMRPDGSAISLYYAHLDSQMVEDGQRVNAGDVIGLTGNTGNAKNTVSHLHFGIYTNSGAIDPLLFIKPAVQKKMQSFIFPGNPSFSILKPVKMFTAADKSSPAAEIEKNAVMTIRAVTDDYYRIALADSRAGFILKSSVKLK